MESQADKQATKGEQFETLKREDKALLTPSGNVQYKVNPSTYVTVQDKAP